MKASYNKIHNLLKSYIKTKDFTTLCRELKSLGIVKRTDIYDVFKLHYTSRYLISKKISAYRLCFDVLKTDLDKKEHNSFNYIPMNFLECMKRNKNAGTYKKILILGNKHIYWASPIFGHADYNKSIWRENTPENREKMNIINRFLNK